MTSRELHIGLSLSPVWLRGKAWRLPHSGVEEMFSPAQTIAIARQAEAAHLDFLFRADTLYLDPHVLGDMPGFSALDPLVQLSLVAGVTDKIGLVTTASTTFHAPYTIARQLSSLHWLSNGRAGWNIVTALDGHQNFGLNTMPSSDWRYQRATEFVDLVQKLWESYPSKALQHDRSSGRFADKELVDTVDHRGEHFQLKGTTTVPGHAAGTPPLFQAGASETGRDFAARVADGIFAAAPTIETAIELRQDLRNRATQFGRGPDAVRVMPGLSFILAKTRAEARDLYADISPAIDLEKRFAFIEANLGIDLRNEPLDAPVSALRPIVPHGVRSRTHADLLLRLVQSEGLSVGELLRRPETTGTAHWQIVGTADDAVETICAWQDAGALDGVIALPGTYGSITVFLSDVVPALAERGRFRREYASSSLAGHLGVITPSDPRAGW